MPENKLIAVAAEDERGLEGQVSAHFGRCRAYTLVDTDGDRILDARSLSNPHQASHQPGLVPNFVRGLGADVIIAGGMGPRAVTLFHQFGIEVATGVVGNVRDAVLAYLRGDLRGTVPCAHDHPESCGGAGAA